MTTKQQQETLDYFKKHADEWRSKADGLIIEKVNVIAQRNGYVLMVAEDRQNAGSFLDVGCGSGELACDIAKRGIDATGVDYASEMIELATQKARDEDVAKVRFECCSIFDYQIPPEGYDLISANGFIEYISPEDMILFFERMAQALAPGGSFVVGSRNRLFNLMSMNDYTVQEAASDGLALLLREAVKWAAAGPLPEFDRSEVAPLQALDTEHQNTGIDVTKRFQYSPFQLMALLRDAGLQTVEVYAVHIHGVTPAFKQANPHIHVPIANLLQEHARHNTQLLPHASTFMLHVKKDAK